MKSVREHSRVCPKRDFQYPTAGPVREGKRRELKGGCPKAGLAPLAHKAGWGKGTRAQGGVPKAGLAPQAGLQEACLNWEVMR